MLEQPTKVFFSLVVCYKVDCSSTATRVSAYIRAKLTCLPSAFFSLTTFNWAHSNWLFTINEELCFVSFNPVTIFPLSGEDGQFAQVVSTVHPLNIPKDYGFVQRLLIFIHTINTLPKFVRGGPQFSTVLIHPIQNWWAHHVITGNMAWHYDIVTQGCDKNSRLMDYD